YLFQSYGARPDAIGLAVTVEEVSMGIDTAVPCGLILNELVTNSLTHAFPTGRGKIGIDLRQNDDNKFVLTVRDNGIGYSKSIDPRKSESLGWQLVNGLADQLGAAIEVSNDGGTVVQITFEELKYKERK